MGIIDPNYTKRVSIIYPHIYIYILYSLQTRELLEMVKWNKINIYEYDTKGNFYEISKSTQIHYISDCKYSVNGSKEVTIVYTLFIHDKKNQQQNSVKTTTWSTKIWTSQQKPQQVSKNPPQKSTIIICRLTRETLSVHGSSKIFRKVRVVAGFVPTVSERTWWRNLIG